MKIKSLIITSLFLLPSFCFALAPVSGDEHEKLMKGEMLQTVTWKEGYVWPEVSMRVLVTKPAREAMETFMDFEAQKNYIPDMLESKVVKKISPENMHVYGAMAMPWPVNKSTYVTNNVLTKGVDGSYTLKWNLVEAKFIKSTDGYMAFKNYHGKTLMEYVTFIVPNSSFAGMFKDRVATDVKKTVQKITQHIDKAPVKKDPAAQIVNKLEDGRKQL